MQASFGTFLKDLNISYMLPEVTMFTHTQPGAHGDVNLDRRGLNDPVDPGVMRQNTFAIITTCSHSVS